jgi:hypothetical protein
MSKDELDKFIADTNEVGNRIKFIDRLIMKVQREELKQEYTKQMLVLIDDYKLMTLLLKKSIEQYIKTNKNNVEYFAYYKILKGFKQNF